MSYTLVL